MELLEVFREKIPLFTKDQESDPLYMSFSTVMLKLKTKNSAFKIPREDYFQPKSPQPVHLPINSVGQKGIFRQARCQNSKDFTKTEN